MITFFIYGLIIGSFSNVLIHRLPIMIEKGENKEFNLFNPRSHCPKCKANIQWYGLIPIISWLALKGLCRNCNGKISVQYPLVEMVHGAIWVLISLNHTGPESIIWGIFTSTCVTLAIIDVKSMLLPNILTYFLIIFGFMVSLTYPQVVDPTQSFIGGIAGYTLMLALEKIYKKRKNKVALGGGDIKYISALGVWFGILNLPTILIIASLSALIYTILTAVRQKKLKQLENQYIPFGVYLTFGGIIVYAAAFSNYIHDLENVFK